MENRNIRNTAFTFMFNREDYQAKLYNYINGTQLTEDDIEIIQLEDRLKKSNLYNDVAFITEEGRLIVLIEHQSTLSTMMLHRMNQYFSALIDQHVLKEQGKSKFTNENIDFPKAEFFIVYNGEGKMPANQALDLGAVKLEAKAININYANLLNKDRNEPIVAYAKIIDLVKNKGYDINDAIDEALSLGYLPEFFMQKEIRDMFAEYFSYENELRREGYKEGVEQGAYEKAVETAKRMFEEGLDLETVLRITELDIETIQSLKQG